MAKKMKECPFCGAEVNKANLGKHFIKAHQDLDERDFELMGLNKPRIKAERDGQKETKGARKRKPKKRDTVGIAVSIIAVLVVLSS